jgi:hypothetical protein
MFKRFVSFTNVDFVRHLNESGAYFVMCHDGAMPDTAESNRLLRSRGKNDTLANEEAQPLAHGTKDSTSPTSTRRLRKVSLRTMIRWFMKSRYNVALINELHCVDSKVSHLAILSRHISF